MSACNIPWHPNRRNALTKDQLLNGLNNILNNFLYGFMCSRLVTPEAWREASRAAVLFKGPEKAVQIELGPLAKRAINPTVGFTRNYENSLLRTILGSLIARGTSAVRRQYGQVVAGCGGHPQREPAMARVNLEIRLSEGTPPWGWIACHEDLSVRGRNGLGCIQARNCIRHARIGIKCRQLSYKNNRLFPCLSVHSSGKFQLPWNDN